MKRFGDLSNFLNDERRWSVVVTNYQDFYKIVCEYVKRKRPEVNTTKEAEKYIEENNGKELILATYHQGKKILQKESMFVMMLVLWQVISAKGW